MFESTQVLTLNWHYWYCDCYIIIFKNKCDFFVLKMSVEFFFMNNTGASYFTGFLSKVWHMWLKPWYPYHVSNLPTFDSICNNTHPVVATFMMNLFLALVVLVIQSPLVFGCCTTCCLTPQQVVDIREKYNPGFWYIRPAHW